MPDSLRFVNLRQIEPFIMNITTGSALVAGEVGKVPTTEKLETLHPWVYDGVVWQYADGHEVVYPSFEEVLAAAAAL